MVTKRTDYTAEAVEAARSVMLELSRILDEYQEDMVIVGGWVPELLIEKAPRAHMGSLDVDIALNHRTLREDGYKTILQLLLSHVYRQSEQPFIFFRAVQLVSARLMWEWISWLGNILEPHAVIAPSAFKIRVRAKRVAVTWRFHWQLKSVSAAHCQVEPKTSLHCAWPQLCRSW